MGPRTLSSRRGRVEFVRDPRPDLPQRMLEYRALIMGREPGHVLTQHIVVLDRGRVAPRYVNGLDFGMRLHVTYLREHDPAEFLADPALAPLAVLARARSRPERARLLRRALDVLSTVADPERRGELADVTAVLAAIHLDAVTIEEVTKEADMPITLEGTVGGRSLEARAEARGEARGEATATRRLLVTLLRRSFGDDPHIEALAGRLAGLPAEEAVEAVLSAGSLDDLLRAHPAPAG